MVAESGQTPTVHVADERQVLVLDVEFGHQSTCRHFLVANAQEAVDTGLRFPPDHGFNEARMTDLQIRGGGMGSGHTVNSSPAEGHGSDRCWCPAPIRAVSQAQSDQSKDCLISDLTTSIIAFAECVKGSSGCNSITSKNYAVGK